MGSPRNFNAAKTKEGCNQKLIQLDIAGIKLVGFLLNISWWEREEQGLVYEELDLENVYSTNFCTSFNRY